MSNMSVNVTKTIKWLLESMDVSDEGPGVIQPNIPASPGTPPTQEPLQSNQEVIQNTPSAQNPDIEMDNQIKGPEDPVKRFIDKLVDTKNKIYSDESKFEIQKLISQNNIDTNRSNMQQNIATNQINNS